MDVDAGTLLVAGGNEVHAGPRTSRPRMFAFAIGIPEGAGDGDANDGEVQYNPALLHLDLCCICFGDLDFGPVEFDDAAEAKRFLLRVLVDAVRDAPDAEAYERRLGDDRADLWRWLADLARSIDDAVAVDALLAVAVASESLSSRPTSRRSAKSASTAAG